MDTYTTPSLPASSLLDLAKRKVAPFDAPFYLAGVDGTAIDPPMLVEGIDPVPPNTGLGDGIFLSVWPEKRRQHVMHGIFVDEAAILDLAFEPKPR